MGLREAMTDEQAREALTSVPAAELLHGAVRIVEEDFRWCRPWRFSADQLRALGSCQAWHPGLYRQMAASTAGICVELETDAGELALELRVDAEPRGTRAVLAEVDRGQEAPPQPYDGVSCAVDDAHLPCRMPDPDEQAILFKLPPADPEAAAGMQTLPGLARTRHVRIWLPALRGCVVRDVLCDGSFVRPVAARQQLLVLGDSIAQGFVAGDPAHSWPAILSARLDLDVVNQGVGGQVFQPGSLAGLADTVDPARIVIAFGANYRYEPCSARSVSRDIRTYLLEVSRLWPQVPTQVLTPLWHDEEASPSHARSCWEQVPSFIEAHVAPHDQMTFVDGLELLKHDPELFADGVEHPGERACRQIATRLNAIIRIPGLRPSSVGHRRRARRRRARKNRGEDSSSTLSLPLDG